MAPAVIQIVHVDGISTFSHHCKQADSTSGIPGNAATAAAAAAATVIEAGNWKKSQ